MHLAELVMTHRRAADQGVHLSGRGGRGIYRGGIHTEDRSGSGESAPDVANIATRALRIGGRLRQAEPLWLRIPGPPEPARRRVDSAIIGGGSAAEAGQR